MSNVLIGIIGVILFIGLALAGALILGDDFRSSNSDSRASAIVQQLHQTSAAINMYSLKTGSTFASQAALTTLQPRFLRVQPVNPTGAGAYAAFGSSGETTGSAGMVAVALTTNADAVCTSIAQQTGASTYTSVATAAALPTNPVGCFRTTAAINGLASGQYYAYARP